MAKKTYDLPENFDLSDVVSLMPEHTKKVELKPETPVVCLNRGPRVLKDMWNADEYVIPANAKFQLPYAAAKHFQERLIVPGTRNPNPSDASLPPYVSWLAIFGVDPPEACVPFTEEQLVSVGESIEGLNRLAMSAGDQVQIRKTSDMTRGLPGLGLVPSGAASAAALGGVNQEIVGGTDETRERAIEPVVGSDAVSEFAKAETSNWQAPDESALSVRSAPPVADVIKRADRENRGRRGR